MTGPVRPALSLLQGGAQRNRLAVLRGQSMSADDAAWAMIADSVGTALTLPGLSPSCRRLLAEAEKSCRFAAGQDDSVAKAAELRATTGELTVVPHARAALTLVVDG